MRYQFRKIFNALIAPCVNAYNYEI